MGARHIEQKEKLKEIRKIAPKLIKMYGIKEKLRSLFNSNKSEVRSLLKLTHWLKKAALYFPESCGTIIRWFAEIIPYFKNRTTQAPVEGINKKLKLIKRKGFGFRNFDNFRLRSLLSFHFSPRTSLKANPVAN
ncbi:MAG: transposase [Prochloraceae cyanobacterium]|nr:transposase [Prochloraceae cyanobacterium]